MKLTSATDFLLPLTVASLAVSSSPVPATLKHQTGEDLECDVPRDDPSHAERKTLMDFVIGTLL